MAFVHMFITDGVFVSVYLYRELSAGAGVLFLVHRKEKSMCAGSCSDVHVTLCSEWLLQVGL